MIRVALPTDNGEEWKVNSFTGVDRAQTVVKTANSQACLAAAEDNALPRSASAPEGDRLYG